MQKSLQSFFAKVYSWMFLGLIVTATAASLTAFIPTLQTAILGNSFLMIGLIVLELITVIIMSFFLNKMPPIVAILCFLFFALVNGLTLSVVFLVYELGSIYLAFFLTAGIFGLMSLFGFFTKMDLSKLGTILFIGLIGVILASIVNFFLKSSGFEYALSIITIIIFIGLTAYDTQKLKKIAEKEINNQASETRIAIFGALSLYLDFINLFLRILEIFGKKK